MYTLSDFDFELPESLIAQYALADRAASRLLMVKPNRGGIDFKDDVFRSIKTVINAKDLLVFNDTKVLKARLFGNKRTGGAVEILIERIIPDPKGFLNTALAQIRSSKSPKPGSYLYVGNKIETLVGERVGEFFTLHFPCAVQSVLDECGQLPLPPYIQHVADAYDETRYQTVYAKSPGAVAAPTAGLHFDDELLNDLKVSGVECGFLTLHVGAGTFQPVRGQDLTQHQMHREWFEISAELAAKIAKTKKAGGRVIAVGTTSLRALESAGLPDRTGGVAIGAGETQIFIRPGYEFKVVDALITNFHLPKSTLMMLVSAFAGYETIRLAYQHAISQSYRFFSYGDAMWLEKQIVS